jgi:predicted DNA-binding transcriptional regulator AlpA
LIYQLIKLVTVRLPLFYCDRRAIQGVRRMLLKDTEAAKLAAISRTSVWRWARNNTNNFPKPIRIGNRSARWVKADIDAWIEQNSISDKK